MDNGSEVSNQTALAMEEEFSESGRSLSKALTSSGTGLNSDSEALESKAHSSSPALDLPTEDSLRSLASSEPGSPTDAGGIRDTFRELLESRFSDPDLLAQSFCGDVDDVSNSGINFEQLRHTYQTVNRVGPEFINMVSERSRSLLFSLLSESREKEEKWKAERAMQAVLPLLIISENPNLMEPEHHETLKKLLEVVRTLPEVARLRMGTFLSQYGKAQFEQLVSVLQQFLTIQLYENDEVGIAVENALICLSILFSVNEKQSFVPISSFYSDPVNEESFNLREDYKKWKTGASFCFCKFPFVFDAASKSQLLQIESRVQMNRHFEDSIINSVFLGLPVVCPFNVMRVRRDHLIADTMAQIQRRPVEDLKKLLKVHFVGEEGVDEGGVQKEFFQLSVQQILDPLYGMFSYNEETRDYWFHSCPIDMGMEFELTGMLLGMAIYNGVILDLRFPRVIYRKLLGKSMRFEDLKDVNPSLHKGLCDLLAFEGDVEEVFQLTFQVNVRDVFGSLLTVDLKEGGADLAVTNSNRKEYVDLVLKFYLNDSIEKSFQAFARGFQKLCGGPVLQMLQPDELELLVCGSPELDFTELEKATKYDTYTPDSPIIKGFWKVVHELSQEDKKKLLTFVTGSDRAPIKGLASLPFVISRNGPDSDRLPTAHTCFNHLLLPDYNSIETLRKRLLLAISNSQGFGLI